MIRSSASSGFGSLSFEWTQGDHPGVVSASKSAHHRFLRPSKAHYRRRESISALGGLAMISYQSLAWSILSILGWTCQASAGWVIDQAEKGGGDAGKQQLMLQANQMKTVVLGPDGKPESAFIMDLNTETFTQVNYPEGSYMTANIQEYAQKMEGAMKQATRTMEDAMKNMSPEQRKAMERAMGSRMPKAGAGPEACPERKLEIRKTDQQATIAGYPAVN